MLVRRRLFWIVLALMLVVVWRVLEGSDPTEAVSGNQSFVGGLDGILAELNCGGLLSKDQVMRSMQLLCQRVAPKFR